MHRQQLSAFMWRHAIAIRAGLAGLFLVLALSSWGASADPPQLHPVVVAARDVPAGARLSSEDLAEGQDSLGLATPTSVDLVGEIVRGPIGRGEPVTSSRLTPGQSLAPPDGTVVYPLVIEDARIAALLGSGDRVDVLVTPDSLGGGGESFSVPGVEVLAVPQEESALTTGSMSRSGAVVLVSVTDAEAARLARIHRSDHVSLAIR